MIYKGTQSNTRPPRIRIENLPAGVKSVRLADNIEEIENEDGVQYIYDESVFSIKDQITVEELEENFDEYWEKGKEAKSDDPDDIKVMTRTELTHAVIALREENSLIEEALLEMSEKVYK